MIIIKRYQFVLLFNIIYLRKAITNVIFPHVVTKCKVPVSSGSFGEVPVNKQNTIHYLAIVCL